MDIISSNDFHEMVDGNEGFIALVDAMPRIIDPRSIGPEQSIVDAARVSYGHINVPIHGRIPGNESAKKDNGIPLLKYLMKNGHMSPFEMVVLKFCVRAPNFTAKQWMRHRTGSFNEISARYTEVHDAYHIPPTNQLKKQSRSNRQGSSGEFSDEESERLSKIMKDSVDASHSAYKQLLDSGMSRELARLVLPECRYTTFYWTVNLRNLFHFIGLRSDSASQENIRNYSDAICRILTTYCPIAMEAYKDYVLNVVTFTGPEIRSLRSDYIHNDGKDTRELFVKLEKISSLPTSITYPL